MIAIEFTAKNLQIVLLSTSGQGVSVKRCFSVPIEAGLIRNGYIDSVKSLAEIMRKVFFEESIRDNKVTFTLDSTSIKTKRVEVPYDTREHVLQFMEKEMGEIITDEEHMLDYIINGIRVVKKKKTIDATLYAIPRATMQRYIDLAAELHLSIQKISILNDSIAKQVQEGKPIKQAVSKKKKGAEPIEDIGIVSKKVWAGVYYERLKLITRDVNGELSNRTVMLGFESADASEDGKQDREIITRYVDEIRRHIMVQDSTGEGQPIESMELFGERPMLNQMAELIQQLTQIETRCLKKPKQIKGISADEYPKYAGAIGSAVRR